MLRLILLLLTILEIFGILKNFVQASLLSTHHVSENFNKFDAFFVK